MCIRDRYNDVLAKKNFRLEQLRQQQREKEILKDPESHGYARHQPQINPNSKRLLEDRGDKLIYIDDDGSRSQRQTRKQMYEDFMDSTQNWQKKAEQKKETATNKVNNQISKQCTFKPYINKISQQIVQANNKPADFYQRSEYYEDRKQLKLQRVQKLADKELRFQPEIYHRKPALKYGVKAPTFSDIKPSEGSGTLHDSINRDLHDLNDPKLQQQSAHPRSGELAQVAEENEDDAIDTPKFTEKEYDQAIFTF